MSRTEDEPDDKGAPVQQADPPKPIPLEDWYLVRTKDGKAGWVLSRMVSMAIPDEVAQYAEGHRITSYFSLGKVDDDGVQKTTGSGRPSKRDRSNMSSTASVFSSGAAVTIAMRPRTSSAT